MKRFALTLFTIATLLLLLHTPILRAFPEGEALIPMLSATPTVTVSTVPPNGDVNPYGVAFVPRGFPKGGPLEPGDVLVANFNDGANLQEPERRSSRSPGPPRRRSSSRAAAWD
jgi:hypothetical protein